MKFIDNTGHIFTINHYIENPIGYEFEQSDYVFWFDNEYSYKMSVGNYYIKPVRFILESNESINFISIKIESDIYKLYGFADDNFTVDIKNLTNEIIYNNDNNSLNVIKDVPAKNSNNIYNIYTFYVIAKCDDEGSFFSNIIINVNSANSNIWCPITVGSTFVDECEELTINARNIGVKLPKQIMRAIYKHPYETDSIDEAKYNVKLKEYLINFMKLRAESGNYDSALSALKFFEYGNLIHIAKLLRTDNEILSQYILDYFNIDNDVLDSYKDFRQTTLLSLYIKENDESGLYNKFDNTNPDINKFRGECKPILEDLFSKKTTININGIDFESSVYRYSLQEMMLKLSCLSYMYKKYFLPVHLSIHSASIRQTVFANDIKLLNTTTINITECPIYTADTSYKVEFSNVNKYYLYNRNVNTYIDDNFNTFKTYDKLPIYEKDNSFNLICITPDYPFVEVPIKFITNDKENSYYDCKLILSTDNEHIYESSFKFSQNNNEDYISFVISPLLLQNKDVVRSIEDFWISKKFRIDLCCNGTWYFHDFTIAIPDLELNFGKIEYKYNNETDRQFSFYNETVHQFNSHIIEPGFVESDTIDFIDILEDIADKDKNGIGEFDMSFDESFNITTLNSIMHNNLNSIEKIKISNKLKFYNRIVLYDITSNGQTILYKNEEFNKELYDDFFLGSSLNIIESNLNSLYDFYLMHDKSKYYGIFISKNTIDKDTKFDFNDFNISVNGINYAFNFVKESPIFLINRMKPIYSTVNHFHKDDIVFAKLSHPYMKYKIAQGSKWEFEKYSLGKPYIETVYSKTNTAIMDIPKEYSEYMPGYYNVTVNYALDYIFNHNYKAKGKICIEQ